MWGDNVRARSLPTFTCNGLYQTPLSHGTNGPIPTDCLHIMGRRTAPAGDHTISGQRPGSSRTTTRICRGRAASLERTLSNMAANRLRFGIPIACAPFTSQNHRYPHCGRDRSRPAHRTTVERRERRRRQNIGGLDVDRAGRDRRSRQWCRHLAGWSPGMTGRRHLTSAWS